MFYIPKKHKICYFEGSLLFHFHFTICIVPHYTQQMHAYAQTLSHKNCIQKITSLLCRLKIRSVPHHSTNHSPVLFLTHSLSLSLALFLFLSLLPFLTILVFFLHFNLASKLRGPNCPVNSVGWTGRQEVCANAEVSLLSPCLSIFLSKWCCQEPNKISLSAFPQQGVNTPSRKWNIREKTKVNKMVAFWLWHFYCG